MEQTTGIWDTYSQRMNTRGISRRETNLLRENRMIHKRLPNSLSYQTIEYYPQEYCYNIDAPIMADKCSTQEVAIINSDNLNTKLIYSLPGEDISLGSLVHWMDEYWIVTERDANTTLYTKAKMLQCNHLLKWINENGVIIKQWCIFDDGTKYLTGFLEDRNFFTRRGDARASLQLSRNEHTILLGRNNRFLIDDDDRPHKMCYQLTKPLKGNLTYNNKGTYSFTLQEVVATENDNHELGICDYYLYFPKADSEVAVDNSEGTETIESNEQSSGTESNTIGTSVDKRSVWI